MATDLEVLIVALRSANAWHSHESSHVIAKAVLEQLDAAGFRIAPKEEEHGN